jgi:diguanylate cyclase (GGDEF)-like protein
VNGRSLRLGVHILPGGLVLIASAWVVTRMPAAPPSMAELLRIAPYAIFATGLILSALFHRSRIFHSLLVMAISISALTLSAQYLSSASFGLLVRTLALLLPLNLAFISLLPERGIFTIPGVVRLGIIAAQGAAIAFDIRFYSQQTVSLLDRPFLHSAPFTHLRGLSQSILTSLLVAFVLLLVQLIRHRFRPTDIGIYWSALCGIVGLSVAQSPQRSTLAFTAGGTVLVIALLEAFYDMAYVDELTDLPSRRSFNDAKSKLGSTYSVAMVDVDHFKAFNDNFGHDTGDDVLRMVASKLTEVTGGGTAYRYGGEEFAVLFPGKHVDEIFPHLERLRKNIEEASFRVRGKDRRKMKKSLIRGRKRTSKNATVTVSIGAAGVAGERRNPDLLVTAADKALYRAKSCGRNCTIVSDQD